MWSEATRGLDGGRLELPNLVSPRATSRQSLRKQEEEAAKLSSYLRTAGTSGLGSSGGSWVQVVQEGHCDHRWRTQWGMGRTWKSQEEPGSLGGPQGLG